MRPPLVLGLRLVLAVAGDPRRSGCPCLGEDLLGLGPQRGERSSVVSVCSTRCGFRRSKARSSRSYSSRSAALRQRVVKP